MKLSEIQKEVTDPAASVWLAASAGTGKTFVLALRVMRLLLAGANPAGILCLTYTRAGAAEMRARILARLKSWAVMDEEKLRAELAELGSDDVTTARRLFARVLDESDSFKIQTIHSFCQSLLARFPLEADVPPDFKLIEGRQSVELIREAKVRLLSGAAIPDNIRNLRDMARESLRELAIVTNEDDVVGLALGIASQRSRLSRWVEHHGGFDHAIASIRQALGVPPDMTEEKLIAEFHPGRLIDDVMAKRIAGVLLEYGKAAREAELAEGLLNPPADVEDYIKVFLTKKYEIRAFTDFKTLKERGSEYIDIILAEAERIQAWHNRRMALRCAIASENIITLALAVVEIYRHLKLQHGLADYQDLLDSTHRLLTGDDSSWVLYRLDAAIEHLLIDEAQDTSIAQWQIMDALTSEFFSGEGASSAPRSLFVVGDYKQSIFSFQGAAPEHFNQMGGYFATKAKAAGVRWLDRGLHTSFRSSGAVIDVINEILKNPAARKGVSADEVEHMLHRSGHAGRVECWPLVEPVEKGEKLDLWQLHEYTEPDNAAMHMAAMVADKISGWLENKRHLAGYGREVRPGDIMVLVKKRDQLVWLLRRELRQRKVPVAGADRLVLNDDIVAEDLLALAEWLLLPEDDFTLAAVLKSPLAGLDENALFAMCHGRSGSLWDSLRTSNQYAETALKLGGWLTAADNIMPYELFHQVIATDGVRESFIARFGNAAEEIIDGFLKMALEYEQIEAPSLQGFVRWMKNSAYEIKREMSSARDEVRIITVHSSKGLEAPIVILPDANNTGRDKEKLFWTGDDISAPPIWRKSNEFDCETVVKIRAYADEQHEDEQRRLIYVALTRARDELYVGGCGKRKEDSCYDYVATALEKIGTDENGALCYSCPQTEPPHIATEDEATILPPPPEWIAAPLPSEAEASAVAPSGSSGDAAGNAVDYGIWLHRLLQQLPSLPRSRWREVALRLKMEGAEEKQINEMLASVTSLVDDDKLKFIFAANSLAEVPLSGKVDGVNINGQIDRLVIDDDKVLVVDFKTGRKVPDSAADVPTQYKRQLEFYAGMVAQIYPGRKVETAILWTASNLLMTL